MRGGEGCEIPCVKPAMQDGICKFLLFVLLATSFPDVGKTADSAAAAAGFFPVG